MSGLPTVRGRRGKRCALLLSAGAALLALCGCGGVSFDGGSFPIGGARVTGTVIGAESPRAPLEGATVTVTPLSGGKPQQAITDKDGLFTFTAVPVADANSALQVTITPASAESRQAETVTFRAARGDIANLVAALPASSFDVAQGASISIDTPPTIPPDASVPINAHVLDKAGKALPVMPTLLFLGNFGTVSIDGTFTASAAGVGAIFAFWYNLAPVGVPIISDPSAAVRPPAPPPVQVTDSPSR